MSRDDIGVQCAIREEYKWAVYFHCASHCLNLVLTTAADEYTIRNAVGLMNEIAVFFAASNKRLLVLQEAIAKKCPESERTRLKKQCATRWVERHDAVIVFKHLYPAVIEALKVISMLPGDAGLKACMLLREILAGGFLVALEIFNKVLMCRHILIDDCPPHILRVFSKS
ncbi:hypothetical protein CAPTEDRAFT_210743 [Capitella teleta]|uniref:DUF4371 domain-containing protein n=1 Tax=Capitella teleta TaxID=283909 RepID=R7VIS2_CAPTE|nr:hypothetical protein CAPTEDRAFT_210743 [Capitella teleta]|eukprot:ELU16166.1 hypothetical protein CAPTEDRAFT_210743 [Capitella teleta]